MRERNIHSELMIIVCPRCGLLYTVDPAELADEPRTMRCSGCEWEWPQSAAEALPDDDEALRQLALRVNGSVTPRLGPPPTARSPRPAGVAKPVAPIPARPAPPAAPLAVPAAAAAENKPVQAKPASAERAVPVEPEWEEPERDDSVASFEATAADESVTDSIAPPHAVAEVEPKVDEAEAAREPTDQVIAAKALNARVAADDHAIPPVPAKADGGKANAPKVRRSKRPPTAILAGGAVAATLLVAVGLLATTRGPIIAAFPGAAGVYRSVGFSVPHDFAEGIEIRDVSSSRSWGDKGQILTVEGDLANIAGQPRSLPMVRVVLVDGSDAEVQEVVVPPPSATLPVGESIRFEARINNPVETAKRIKVSLAPPQKPS